MLTVVVLTATVGYAQPGAKKTEKKEKKVYPPGSAWRLSYPLGDRIESTMDTVLLDYHREFVTALQSDAWASTGQFTGPGIDMIYFNREQNRPFYFENAISHWVPTFEKQKFYNVYIPYTQLTYKWGTGAESRTDNLRATFAGNVNRKVGVGAWFDYPYTKASYDAQSAKGIGFGVSGYYTGSRYEMQAFFNQYNHLNKENGGITDDLYITDPAQLQGGVTKIDSKSIPTRLSATHNRLVGSEFYMNHVYKLGFWRDITQEGDTVQKQEYVPVTKIIYTFDWKNYHRLFLDADATEAEQFWENTYFTAGSTREHNRYWTIANTIGVEMVEGFQKWAKFGLGVYATYEIDRYGYEVEGMDERPSDPTEEGETPTGLTPLPEGYEAGLGETRHRLWVGGRLAKTKGSIIRYASDAKFGLSGDVLGDIDISGDIETRFRMGKDTVRVSAHGFFRNVEPNYMMQHYVGNHFIWNNDFGKIRSFRAEGRLYIPWSKTELRVGVENVQNQVYFNTRSLPQQYGGSVQIFSASIDQKLRFGIWNWDNRVTYQTSSNSEVIPLPKLAVYSNMYLYFKAFKALTVQVGVDCDYYTRYWGLDYQPATMTFRQRGGGGEDVGNFILSNVYLNFKLYKVRAFLMYSHVNQGWFSKGYFSLPHYPIDPHQFRLGLSIDFTD